MDAYKTINAHVETVGTAPSYRRGFKKRPIQMKDDSPFVFAGLWEGWRDPAKDEWVHTCTTITGEANDLVREIHTRMPVILPEEHHQAWLSGEAGKEILIPYTGEKNERLGKALG